MTDVNDSLPPLISLDEVNRIEHFWRAIDITDVTGVDVYGLVELASTDVLPLVRLVRECVAFDEARRGAAAGDEDLREDGRDDGDDPWEDEDGLMMIVSDVVAEQAAAIVMQLGDKAGLIHAAAVRRAAVIIATGTDPGPINIIPDPALIIPDFEQGAPTT